MFYKRHNRLYMIGFTFMFLSVGLGFIYSQCIAWPKEFRQGVQSKLGEINYTQEKNEDDIAELKWQYKNMYNTQKAILNMVLNKTND